MECKIRIVKRTGPRGFTEEVDSILDPGPELDAEPVVIAGSRETDLAVDGRIRGCPEPQRRFLRDIDGDAAIAVGVQRPGRDATAAKSLVVVRSEVSAAMVCA